MWPPDNLQVFSRTVQTAADAGGDWMKTGRGSVRQFDECTKLWKARQRKTRSSHC